MWAVLKEFHTFNSKFLQVKETQLIRTYSSKAERFYDVLICPTNDILFFKFSLKGMVTSDGIWEMILMLLLAYGRGVNDDGWHGRGYECVYSMQDSHTPEWCASLSLPNWIIMGRFGLPILMLYFCYKRRQMRNLFHIILFFIWSSSGSKNEQWKQNLLLWTLTSYLMIC